MRKPCKRSWPNKDERKRRLSPRLLVALILVSTQLMGADGIPDFVQYQVKRVFKGAPAPVELGSHPNARRFRTMLREGAERGENFAGQYTIITWGCGTACQEISIVDASTGAVHFPPNLRLNAYHMVTDGSDPFRFRIDSRLLVVTGSPNDTNETGIFYYTWDGRKLKRIGAVRKTWPR